jgi:formylmethanofuran dehydrogenase subunit E
MDISETNVQAKEKAVARCSECDREVTHHNTFLASTGEERVVCWECLSREEKGFNAKRDFKRDSRRGVIPR